MPNAVCTVLTLAAILLGCVSGHSESTNAPLTFYIVSQQRLEGGRFINTTNFPELGYIAAHPDLTVTNLADVFPAKVANFAIMGDGNGTNTVVPTQPPPSLTVVLTDGDARKFTLLTERALDKQLLIMLGERPLTAPRVLFPIMSPAFGIDFTNAAEMKLTEDGLKGLVR